MGRTLRMLAAAAAGIAACCAVGIAVRGGGSEGAAMDPQADLKTVLEAVRRSEAQITSLRGYFTWTRYEVVSPTSVVSWYNEP